MSWSTLSSLISLLPTTEYDLWIREMTVAQLDFRNPEGLEIFNCFKKVCIIERNTNECSRSDPIPEDVQTPTAKKTTKSSSNQIKSFILPHTYKYNLMKITKMV